MANESKTSILLREFLRSKDYFQDKDIVIEEQQSDNAKVDKLLKNASKRGMGKGYPDFIIYSNKYPELIIVIECKADINKHESETLDNYSNFAVDGSLLYASFLSKEFDVLAIGISGESKNKHHISHHLQLKGDNEKHRIFSDRILSFDEYKEGILQSDFKFNQDYAKLVVYTKTLNEQLHSKKIKESQRALLISGILIALKSEGFKKGYKGYQTITLLVNNLYATICGELDNSDIPNKTKDVLKNGFNFLKTNSSIVDDKNGKKFLEDLIDAIDREINGFMFTHQYVDTVSQFYVEFLRYANNDKGLGIVLTPPHITDLFSELAGVNKESIVFDNCCGTGGFLISAMKKMLKDANGDQQKEKDIKNKQLVGIEYDDDIYTLLVSNMIIHRDGRTNIFWGDCFKRITDVKQKFKPSIGFLNPPYKTKASDEEEIEFILNNLDALQPDGTCIAIIPISCVIEKSVVATNLKRRLLKNHTLEAVLSMPEELFHNSKVNTVTCVVILTAHRPHPKGKKTWFAYCRNDGFVKVKNKGRIDANHSWSDIKQKWVTSYHNRDVIDGFSLMEVVSENDEWCVEAYLKTDYSKLTFEDFEDAVKKFIMFNLMDMTGVKGEGDINEDLRVE